MIHSVDPKLKSIRDKVDSGERLSFDDGYYCTIPRFPSTTSGNWPMWSANESMATLPTTISTHI